jgi:hypothetical protein
MLPVARRALLIGMLGPGIQGLGITWTTLHLLFAHWSDPIGPRHLFYEPGVLLILVGFAVSVISVPVALEIARVSEEEVEIPVYEPDALHRGGGRVPQGRLARYSAGRTHQATGPDQQSQSRG